MSSVTYKVPQIPRDSIPESEIHPSIHQQQSLVELQIITNVSFKFFTRKKLMKRNLVWSRSSRHYKMKCFKIFSVPFSEEVHQMQPFVNVSSLLGAQYCCSNCYQLISHWNILFVSFLVKEPTILFCCLGSHVACDSVAQNQPTCPRLRPHLPPEHGVSPGCPSCLGPEDNIHRSMFVTRDTRKHGTVAWFRKILYLLILIHTVSSRWL